MSNPNTRQRGTSWMRLAAALVVVVILLLWLGLPTGARQSPADPAASAHGAIAEVSLAELPAQAGSTLALIRSGGPFPYRKDGTVFGNRERLLPLRHRGYYTEYTVPTPKSRDRGARRIVAGGDPARSSEFYYTDDHYASFRKIRDPIQ